MNTPNFQRPLAGALALAVSAALAAAPAAAQQEQEQPPQERQDMQEAAQQQGQSLMAMAEERSELSLFAAAVKRAGLENELNQNGPYTIFAPNDEAFRSHFDQQEIDRLTGDAQTPGAGQQGEQAREGQADRGQRQEQTGEEDAQRRQQEGQESPQQQAGDQPTQQDRQQLLELVRSHIVSGEWTSQQLREVGGLQDVLGRRVAVSGQGQQAERRTTGAEGREDTAEPGQQQERTEQQDPQEQSAERETMARGSEADLQFGDAGVVETDIRASNGVLHVVDAVVQTSGPAQQPQQDTERERRPEQQRDSATEDTTGTGS